MKKEICNNCKFFIRGDEVCTNKTISSGEYLEYRYKNTPACLWYKERTKTTRGAK